MAFSFVIPVGLDFADGVEELPAQPYESGGTPTIVGTKLPTAFIDAIGLNSDETFLEEQAGSPRIERAEQCTCEHTIKMDVATTIAYWSNMPRGTIVSDTDANIWRVLSCTYVHDSELYATLSYTMEALSFDSPPDDFDLVDVSLDLFIIKHPRYWRWLCPYSGDLTPTQLSNDPNGAMGSIAQIKEAIIRVIQNYIESPFYPSQNMTQNYLQANIIYSLASGSIQLPVTNPNFDPKLPNVDPVVWSGLSTDLPSLKGTNCPYFLVSCLYAYNQDNAQTGPIHMALATATEIISKLWRQEDTPIIPSYEVVWIQRFFQAIYLNPGGYQEDPRDVVPSYFMGGPQPGFENIGLIPRGDQGQVGPVDDTYNSDLVPPIDTGDDSIFAFLTTINPQLFSSDGTPNGTLNISSIRTTDTYRYERTWFEITHRWKVACVGKWDSDLYPEYGASGPQSVYDFNNNPVDASGI